MVVSLSDYIVSPLGVGTRATYEAVKQGRHRLRCYEARWGVPQPFVASLFDDGEVEAVVEGLAPRCSRFERLCILTAQRALQGTDVDVRSPRTLFVLSTTKGDLFQPLGATARHIAQWFGNKVTPLVVCNACISGLHALVEAWRMITSGDYDYAVVIGADLQSDFTVNGFYSLKALSPEPCRPFDEDRMGLNLGDGAACIVLGDPLRLPQRGREGPFGGRVWRLVRGAVRNDSYHVSSPSKNAEGYYQALRAVTEGLSPADIAFVNLHGTATLYNDEMESVGLTRAGLAAVPVNSLKGYLGHTMGAAGIIETVLSMRSLEEATVLGTRGYRHAGTSRPLNLSPEHRQVSGTRFVKTLSGFGGGNAAMLFEMAPSDSPERGEKALTGPSPALPVGEREWEREISIASGEAPQGSLPPSYSLPPTGGAGEGLGVGLKELYLRHVGDYPKFYKMDPLCRLGLVATELLLQAEGEERFTPRSDRAVLLVGRSASIVSDRAFQQTIQDPAACYPSPSVFVYTLPNIVAGEIAMRNHYHGETAYYVLPELDWQRIEQLVAHLLADPAVRSVVGGWIDYEDNEHFEAKLKIWKN